MRTGRFTSPKRHHRWFLTVAVLVTLALWASLDLPSTVADDDEIILSVEILEIETGAPLTSGAVRIQSSKGALQTVGHGRHATIEEGDFVTLEALLPEKYAFHHWDGLASPGGARRTMAFSNDVTIRLFVILPTSESDDESDYTDSASLPRDSTHTELMLGIAPESKSNTAASRLSRMLTIVWVDFQNLGIENGTQSNPFDTVAEGVSALVANAATTISFKSGVSQETPTLSTPMILDAPGATARIGVDTFAVTHTLTTSVTGSGNVSGAGVYIESTNATVNASASSGWAFSHWNGDLSGFTNPTAVPMNTNKSVAAVFVQNPANLEVTSVTLSGGGVVPNEARAGDSFTLVWTVLNDSGNAASSSDTNWVDNVFLSRDSAFDGEDKALSVSGVAVMGPVGANNNYMASATITIPDASPGDYFLLIRTDVGGEVTHTAAARAAGISANPITLIDPELTQ